VAAWRHVSPAAYSVVVTASALICTCWRKLGCAMADFNSIGVTLAAISAAYCRRRGVFLFCRGCGVGITGVASAWRRIRRLFNRNGASLLSVCGCMKKASALLNISAVGG